MTAPPLFFFTLNASAPVPQPILQVRGLKTHFPVRKGFLLQRQTAVVRALDGVSLDLHAGEVLGIVGESGCGKSTLARTLMRLTPQTAGEILLDGNPLAPDRHPRAMQMVFQDPYASLNPRHTVFDTLAEPLAVHRVVPREKIPARVGELLARVGLSPRHVKKYPHEFSGGQRQRVAIARALALEPRILIADEPVSALDVSIQAQLINLFADLVAQRGLALIFISHDLSVVKHISRKIAVMYLGKIVETGPADAIIGHPRHPYTRALVSAIPTIGGNTPRILLPGDPPSPLNPPAGCPFHPRCPFAAEPCRARIPQLAPDADGRLLSCLRAADLPAAL
ncbi:MAG: ATP-binding cassette domain-containing protein [Opitutaceae bacterium]|jgi:oligopeptide transport system ATP-binding protein|nr:ATP-binding cassette domain-containing protein [Opitutaceae bacterium]